MRLSLALPKFSRAEGTKLDCGPPLVGPPSPLPGSARLVPDSSEGHTCPFGSKTPLPPIPPKGHPRPLLMSQRASKCCEMHTVPKPNLSDSRTGGKETEGSALGRAQGHDKNQVSPKRRPPPRSMLSVVVKTYHPRITFCFRIPAPPLHGFFLADSAVHVLPLAVLAHCTTSGPRGGDGPRAALGGRFQAGLSGFHAYPFGLFGSSCHRGPGDFFARKPSWKTNGVPCFGFFWLVFAGSM